MPKYYVRHTVIIKFEHQVEADSEVDAENAAVGISNRYMGAGTYRVVEDRFDVEEVE